MRLELHARAALETDIVGDVSSWSLPVVQEYPRPMAPAVADPWMTSMTTAM